MRKVAIFIVVALLLSFCAMPVYANGGPPGLPDIFYGHVTINKDPAPDGTQIKATVAEGEVLTTSQNPVATVNGNYGIDGLPLLVQGYDLSGAITFYVNDVEVEGVTAIFEAGGGPTPLELSVTIAAPAPGPGPAPRYYVETNLFGIEERIRISDEGEILETIEATSEDGMLTLTIPDGTIALDEDGNPLESLEVAVDETPPDPPEDAYIIGLAYDFGPDGATFDPPITLEYTYDPGALPEGVAEEDLVLAYYDEEVGEWVELECVVDTVNNTITADVEHFTTFAIIGAVTPPEEEEVVPPEEEEVVPPEEEEVVLPPEEEVVPPEEVVPAKPLVNWPVLSGIIGGVIVLGLIIFFLVRRRRVA